MQTLNIENKTIYEPFGLKEEFEKLKDYVEVKPESLKVGYHFRYTVNIYKEEIRKCCYAIVTGLENDNNIKVKGYKSEHPDWTIQPNHKYKKYRFYRRKQDIEKESLNRE